MTLAKLSADELVDQLTASAMCGGSAPTARVAAKSPTGDPMPTPEPRPAIPREGLAWVESRKTFTVLREQWSSRVVPLAMNLANGVLVPQG